MRVIFFLIFLVLVACGPASHEDWDAKMNGNDPLSTKPLPADPSYAEINDLVLKAYCMRCHDEFMSEILESPNLEGYENVFKNKDKIRESVVSGKMPKDSPPLSDEIKEFLIKWIDRGAPEFVFQH